MCKSMFIAMKIITNQTKFYWFSFEFYFQWNKLGPTIYFSYTIKNIILYKYYRNVDKYCFSLTFYCSYTIVICDYLFIT